MGTHDGTTGPAWRVRACPPLSRIDLQNPIFLEGMSLVPVAATLEVAVIGNVMEPLHVSGCQHRPPPGCTLPEAAGPVASHA